MHIWMKANHDPTLGYINNKRMNEEFIKRGMRKLFLLEQSPSPAEAIAPNNQKKKTFCKFQRVDRQNIPTLLMALAGVAVSGTIAAMLYRGYCRNLP